jgi:hypothetical protein
MYLVPRAGAGPTTLHPCKITLKSGHVYGPAPFAAEGFGQPIQLDAGDLLGLRRLAQSRSERLVDVARNVLARDSLRQKVRGNVMHPGGLPTR